MVPVLPNPLGRGWSSPPIYDLQNGRTILLDGLRTESGYLEKVLFIGGLGRCDCLKCTVGQDTEGGNVSRLRLLLSPGFQGRFQRRHATAVRRCRGTLCLPRPLSGCPARGSAG